MQQNTQSMSVERARVLASAKIDVEAMLERLVLRGTNAQARRLAICEQNNPRRAAAWSRLAVLLGTLAPAHPRILARAMMFFIADGKYLQQVFSLYDATDGSIVVCCEDVLEPALAAGVITRQSGQPGRYFVLGTPQAIYIERMDGKTENMPPHCDAMTGWNRRALKIILSAAPAAEQLDAVTTLCALASLRWHDAEA